MERYDAGDRVTVEELISSAESGLEVELTRDGKVVARVVPAPEPVCVPDASETAGDWLADLRKLHASLPPDVRKINWQAALREARDDFSA